MLFANQDLTLSSLLRYILRCSGVFTIVADVAPYLTLSTFLRCILQYSGVFTIVPDVAPCKRSPLTLQSPPSGNTFRRWAQR